MKSFWKASLFRFIIFQILLLFFLIIAFLIIGLSSKRKETQIISLAVRNSYLIGDSRGLAVGLSNSLKADYHYIEVLDKNNLKVMELGKPWNNFLSFSTTNSIYSAIDSADYIVGKIIFHYNMLPYVMNAFYSWIIFIFVSSPFLIWEKRRLKKNYQLELKIKKAEIEARLTQQVSHDIRSPLAVINHIIRNSNSLPSMDARLVTSALDRIDSIANDLLSNTHTTEKVSAKSEQVNLSLLITDLVEEKKIEYKKDSTVHFSLDLEENVFVKLNVFEMKRVLSNLLNNSAEALKGNPKGLIKIKLNNLENLARVSIGDNGVGIPKKYLSELGNRGFSYGKSSSNSGHGLGIFHAVEAIHAVDGEIFFESEEGIGTKILIELPSIEFTNQLYTHVYIDDDELMREVWKSVAIKKNINLLLLSSVNNFQDYKNILDKKTALIYIDSELGAESIKGEQFAAQLHEEGYLNLHISSGHPAENFQQYKWLKYVNKRCQL